jgi:hypothetical protein
LAKVKYDGVVVAVHYTPDNQVDWVRTFLRWGPVFSDRVMLDRQALVEHLESEPLRLIKTEGDFVLVTGDSRAEHDNLEGIPII